MTGVPAEIVPVEEPRTPLTYFEDFFSVAALAAKAVTTTIPIVFSTSGDPVQLGLVTSLTRPGGNVTGFTDMSSEILPKQIGLLHELLLEPCASVCLSRGIILTMIG